MSGMVWINAHSYEDQFALSIDSGLRFCDFAMHTHQLFKALFAEPKQWEGNFWFPLKKRKSELLVYCFQINLGFINQKPKPKDSVTYFC